PAPGTVFGSPIPIRTGPDVTQWAPMTTAKGDQTPRRPLPAAIVVQRRIEWPDTDASGNYHNTAAFRFIEVAETALFERLGLLHDVYGRLPRAHIEADFRRPLVFRDIVDISLRVSKVGRASLTYEYEMSTNGEVAATGRAAADAPGWARGTPAG